MHVLFLSDNCVPETNAPATRLHAHARRWVRAGHEVSVVTCAPNFPRGEVHEGYRNRWLSREWLEGYRVWRVKTFIAANRGRFLRTLDYLSFMVMGFLGGLLPRKPDVIVATSPQFFTAVAGWALSVVRRRPFVFELRDLWPASITAVGALRPGGAVRLMERVELFLYRRAARIIVVTEAFRGDLIARGIAPAKIEVVTNGVDLEEYRPRERDAELARELGVEERFVVGYYGTLGLAHALESVLAAALKLREREDVHFLFVGDGAAREALAAEARELGLRNVSFHASVSKERMPALWSVCDVALVHLKDSPVFRTVVPSKVYEALGAGRPLLLAAPNGEAAALVRAHDCGLCLPPEEPDALAAAVLRLADEEGLRGRHARHALEAAPAYDREHLAAALLASLRGLVRGGALSSGVARELLAGRSGRAAPGPDLELEDAAELVPQHSERAASPGVHLGEE